MGGVWGAVQGDLFNNRYEQRLKVKRYQLPYEFPVFLYFTSIAPGHLRPPPPSPPSQGVTDSPMHSSSSVWSEQSLSPSHCQLAGMHRPSSQRN